jgi:hypothetical protein
VVKKRPSTDAVIFDITAKIMVHFETNWGSHMWARFYFIDTIDIDTEMIRKYLVA